MSVVTSRSAGSAHLRVMNVVASCSLVVAFLDPNARPRAVRVWERD